MTMHRRAAVRAAQADTTPPHGDPLRPQLPGEQERAQEPQRQARPDRERRGDEGVPPPPTHPKGDPLKGGERK